MIPTVVDRVNSVIDTEIIGNKCISWKEAVEMLEQVEDFCCGAREVMEEEHRKERKGG